MKEKLINNLGLKILSIFVAFFVWLVVMNVSNPMVDDSKEVPLEIKNEQVLTSAGRTYEISGKNTVTVRYETHTRDSYRVQASDFRAYIDLADLYDVTGSVPVNIEIVNNKSLIYSAEARPGVVRVVTEELQSKPFDIQVREIGTEMDGYAISEVKLSPSKVTLEGPVSQVGLISRVGVEIDKTGLSADRKGTAKLVFYDANGNSLMDSGKIDRIQVDSPEVEYQLTVDKVKELQLDFEVTGSAGTGYQYVGVTSSVKNVKVNGSKDTLADLTKITIPATELDVSGATADKVVTINLTSYLPEGVTLAESESPTVEVRLRVEKLINRTIMLTESDISLTGQSDNMTYRLNPTQIDVTIQGLAENINGVVPSQLGASLYLSGMTAGSNRGVLKFADSSAYRIVSYTVFTVEVSSQAPVMIIGTSPAETESAETGSPTGGQNETAESSGVATESSAQD